MIAASAISATATAVVHEPLFLQQQTAEATEQDVIEMSSTTGCQFVEDYSWYNYIDTNSNAPQYYEATDSNTTATAYFTYCQGLQNTNAAQCATTNNYASIYVNGKCALNT